MPDLKAWAIAYTAVSEYGPGVALATTRDFEAVERIGMVLPPDDKNAALFPDKFDGRYAMFHRPIGSGGHAWISMSPDLKHWGDPRVALPTRGGPWWDAVRVGIGPAPFRTDDGWLVVYHGVKHVAGGPIYRLGAALFDRADPCRLIARTRRWLLTPIADYERVGDGPNVIFSCGGFEREGRLWLYYGAADSSICLAVAEMADVISLVKNEST
jgi:predicted GH43/DUF377 family glycosyl hydrolase